MKKVTTLVLMLCFILSGALCYANGAARTKNESRKDGVSIGIIERASQSSSDKSSAITPNINGHELSLVFSENLGQVSVEVSTTTGAIIDCFSVLTPNGLQVYIPNAGTYIVTFTLSNGDVYAGEFTVTD